MKSALDLLSEVFGERFSICARACTNHDAAVIKQHVLDLCRFGEPLLKRLAEEKLCIVIGPGAVPDLPGFEYLADKALRGHPEGITWCDIPGAYDARTRTIALGTCCESADGVAYHEMGHALGDIFGYYDDFRVRMTCNALRQTGCYVGPDCKEFFAASVTSAIINKERATALLGLDYVRFVEEVVLYGRASRTK